MAKMALYFDIPDDQVERYIPSVSIDAELYVGRIAGQILMVTDAEKSEYHQGTNATLVVVPQD